MGRLPGHRRPRGARRAPPDSRPTWAWAGGLCLLVGLLGPLPAAGLGTVPSRLTTAASGPVTRRGQITDTATLAGAAGPTGTIAFSVYGPADPTCTGYPAATSTRTVTADGSYVSAPYTAPAAGVYRFVARYRGDAANAAATTSCGDPGESVTVSDPPPPVLGRSFQVGPIGGRIYVMTPGSTRAAKGVGFLALLESRTLPVGSTIDASAGVARITTAAGAGGGLQTGDFGAGVFTVLQNRRDRGLAELDLVVPSPAATRSCLAASTAGRAEAAARRRLSSRVLALLRASAAGHFRTRGRFSAATVRGTIWDTVDRCDGTLTRVRRGVVLVTDFRRAKTIVLAAGKSYLAAAP